MQEIGRRHWLWLAFCNEKLLYGCLVHGAGPEASIPESEQRKLASFNGTEAEILQALLDDDEAKLIAEAVRAQSILDLTRHGGPSIALSGSRHRLIDGFGRRARPTGTYVSAEQATLSDNGWHQVLKFLKDSIGVDFRVASDRLGAFDIYDAPDADDGDPAVEFGVERADPMQKLSCPEEFTLSANGTIADACSVHVELQLGGEPVFSRLIALRPAASRTVTAVPFDHYRMSVFDPSGLLIQFEEHSLLLRVGLNMSAMGPTLTINDPLARSAQGLGTELQDRASKVRTRSTSRSLIGVQEDAAFEIHRTTMRALMHRLVPPSGSDRWFQRGIADEVGVIAHFNSLLDGARVSAGTIVDPYFGIDTLKRVISRLESLDVDLTVVTSLRETDPETNDQKLDLLDELETVLRDLRSDGIPNVARRLRVLNLVDGPRQAFHDRYLLLTPHEGEREVYLLSNSLNRMAGSWPFCMSRLVGAAAREAARYVDALANGQDISGSAQPTTTFQWPSL
ncbi:VPA1262 family N-terminal domain-containing protein [Martelella mediterranea]|uniref:VPA1262 family N-terminal domain-containing protein n=1 Tax=uncultured Martelella sp. TaxID=392331 RepID=UPI000D05AFF0|nr:VPA1262 family N-terminal domain-containing protein [uncultured Martelella sp.]